MTEQTIVGAALLGILEGLTEFIPVSSTGHVLLAGHFMGFQSTGKAFEVLIQLGAILAILTVYFSRLWNMLVTLPKSLATQNLVLGILIAFLPAAVIGAFAHSFIKQVLFETPMLICIMLILGGLILLWVDRWAINPKYTDITRYPTSVYFGIGLFQCLAMIPGTSRSGSTIVGALLLGADKRSAAEFSFFLAMPTMAGAFTLDLIKNHDQMTSHNLLLVGIGFVCSFVAGFFVVKTFLDYVSRHGFALFAWWRVVVGTLGLLLLAIGF